VKYTQKPKKKKKDLTECTKIILVRIFFPILRFLDVLFNSQVHTRIIRNGRHSQHWPNHTCWRHINDLLRYSTM